MIRSVLILFAAASAVAATVNPQSFSVHVPDLNPQDTAKILLTDPSGNLFVISTKAKTSAIVNIHVTKADGLGNALATFDFGGSGIDTPTAASVDPNGNLVIVGTTASTDFPLVTPVQQSGAIFVTKINAQLSQILFSTLLGGSAQAIATAVATDSSGNVYVTGNTGPGFPTTPGVLQQTAPTLAFGIVSSGFITEISASGTTMVFSTYFGGSDYICGACSGPHGPLTPEIYTTPSAIAVHTDGSVVISGVSNASNLPVNGTAYSQQCGCITNVADAFVAKIGGAGTELVWGTYLPIQDPTQNQTPAISGMSLDSSGNVILVGKTGRGLPVTSEAIQSTYVDPGGFDPVLAGFVAKLDSTGSNLLFATYLGGSTEGIYGSVNSVALDSAGNIWLTGNSTPADISQFAGTTLLGTNYIAGISTDGARLLSFFTAPNGAADGNLVVTPQSTLAELGSGGSLLISSSAAQPYLMGTAGSPSSRISNAICARELISFYGVNLGPAAAFTTQITNGTISNSLGGVQVLFNGIPAALLYAGPNQINAIVPSDVSGRQTATVQIVTPSGTIPGPVLAVQDTLPQVFTDSTGFAVAQNQDGTLNAPSNRAQPGTVLTIWITGGGGTPNLPDNIVNTSAQTDAFPISVLTGVQGGAFTSLEVLYAGDAPGSPSGVTQINFQLPSTPGANGYPLMVQAGTATTEFFINVIY